MALQGHCGEIVLDKKTEFVINPEISFVEQADKVILNRVVQLGFEYTRLTDFVANVHHVDSNYLIGVSSGIKEILQEYQLKLVQLEHEIVRFCQVVPFTHFMTELQEFVQVFPALVALTQKVIAKSLRGVDVLELLHQSTKTGFKRIKYWCERLLFHCHKYVGLRA